MEGGKKQNEWSLEKKRNGEEGIVSRWVPDPELWDWVKLAWQLRVEGRSYAEIQEATEDKIYVSVGC
jgi:hypothetical protein